MWARYDRLSLSGVVGELDERSRVVEWFDHGADHAPSQTEIQMIDQKRNDIQEFGTTIFGRQNQIHHTTQQDTNRGKHSPERMIQILLTSTVSCCLVTRTSTRHWAPHELALVGAASLLAAAARSESRNQPASSDVNPSVS
jgi:hypothetical protein